MTHADIKAIFFDVDGTLISHRKHAVPISTIDAIARLRKQGILTFVATGRHPIELKKLLPDYLEFDAYLCLNGMYCFNRQEVISTKPIPKEDIKGLLKTLNLKPFPCTFITQDEMYMNYANDLVAEVQRDISSDVSNTKDISHVLQEDILQVIPYGLDDKEISTVLEYMPHCKATSWHKRARDIIVREGGKDIGIQEILQYYNLDVSQIMAFGDGDNDVKMLEIAGIAVAMGNGNENVKAVADYVTDDIDQDGIANALYHYGIFHETLIK